MTACPIVICIAALALAAPVPAPKPVPGYPTLQEVEAAFGQKYNKQAPRVLGKRCGDPVLSFSGWVLRTEAETERNTHFYWIWKAKGLEVLFEREVMVAAWFNNEGADGHKRYGGELPGGLTFWDDEAAVVAKLGKPDADEVIEYERPPRDDGVVEIHMEYNYPDKGLEVAFRRPVGGKWRIHCIELQPVKKPEKP